MLFSVSHCEMARIRFNLFFFAAIILLHLTQLLVFPLAVILNATILSHCRLHYKCLARKTFAIILILVTQIFAPTRLVLTADDSFDLAHAVHRDTHGTIVGLDLPSHSIIMANHQIYADWLYIWSLAYLADIHSALIIILKASLKWVPLVGPAMQMFSFIFLNRSWATDKKELLDQLDTLAADTRHPDVPALDKIGLLIFPEGTLVSALTRPMSARYAAKSGIDDLKHCLLPRSTGSLFCLRALSRKVPTLQLIDLTIGYPGVPADGYGQDYYTLQSIFGHGRPPPKVHIHIKLIPVSAIPIGTFPSPADQAVAAQQEAKGTTPKRAEIVDPSPDEVARFDAWLRALWADKDALLASFYKYGRFDPPPMASPDTPSSEKLAVKELPAGELPEKLLAGELPVEKLLAGELPEKLLADSLPSGADKGPFECPIRLKSSLDLIRTALLTVPGLSLLLYISNRLFFRP
ncbi:hypothetical protein PTTG_07092 [Puccinia triticina 1-1 BBBD Race 1]|uniref:PlsC domain-containing protein n=1 Tax=Puccinia triticina (isolate 1-1 / race 1 (BBBD)) TaxID=630390 RepID=A0A180GJN9_PUCT1|nr:hypothetical protein PTTG_07092 [Puccinia triticina 1-1 BBBD Race 1]